MLMKLHFSELLKEDVIAEYERLCNHSRYIFAIFYIVYCKKSSKMIDILAKKYYNVKCGFIFFHIVYERFLLFKGGLQI